MHLTQVRLPGQPLQQITRRVAMLCRVSTMATAPYSACCVIAQPFFIQPLGSLRWPAAEQKYMPQARSTNALKVRQRDLHILRQPKFRGKVS